jgi:N-acetylglutamate synthase
MNIRLMTIEDYDEVYRLWAGTPGVGLRTLDDSRAGIAKFLERNPKTSFVAEEGENLAGVILSGNDGRRGYLYHVTVRPEFRRQGIGKALVERTTEALRQEGINRVMLVVYAENAAGNEFWETLGFEKRSDLVIRNISLNPENY